MITVICLTCRWGVVHQRWIYLPQQTLHIDGAFMQRRWWLRWWERRGFLSELHLWGLLLWPVWRLPAQRQSVRRTGRLHKQTGREPGAVRLGPARRPDRTNVRAVRVSVWRRRVHPPRVEVWQHTRLLWWQRWGRLQWVLKKTRLYLF